MNKVYGMVNDLARQARHCFDVLNTMEGGDHVAAISRC